jgi:hypothetical protein
MSDHNTEVPLFEELSGAMVEQICNGCGSKGGPFRPPQWRFAYSCRKHDFSYWVGGSEGDRRRADKAFYADMRQATRARKQWWQRPWYYLMSWVYYRAVRSFGAGYFHFGARRTWADLRERLDP